MRVTKSPDIEIRKGIIEALKLLNYSGKIVPVYDTMVPANENPTNYIIISTQTKVDSQTGKCGWEWDCTVLLDIVNRINTTGNPGNREAVNNIEGMVIGRMNGFAFKQGFELLEDVEVESSDSLDTITATQNVFRQLLRYRLLIAEA